METARPPCHNQHCAASAYCARGLVCSSIRMRAPPCRFLRMAQMAVERIYLGETTHASLESSRCEQLLAPESATAAESGKHAPRKNLNIIHSLHLSFTTAQRYGGGTPAHSYVRDGRKLMSNCACRINEHRARNTRQQERIRNITRKRRCSGTLSLAGPHPSGLSCTSAMLKSIFAASPSPVLEHVIDLVRALFPEKQILVQSV